MDDVLTKVLVLNGLSLYATWTTIAGLVNFSIVLQYTFDIDPSTVGTVTLALLSAVILLYFSLENTVLDPYSRDAFTVYPVVIWALIGILGKHWGVPGNGGMPYLLWSFSSGWWAWYSCAVGYLSFSTTSDGGLTAGRSSQLRMWSSYNRQLAI